MQYFLVQVLYPGTKPIQISILTNRISDQSNAESHRISYLDTTCEMILSGSCRTLVRMSSLLVARSAPPACLLLGGGGCYCACCVLPVEALEAGHISRFFYAVWQTVPFLCDSHCEEVLWVPALRPDMAFTAFCCTRSRLLVSAAVHGDHTATANSRCCLTYCL